MKQLVRANLWPGVATAILAVPYAAAVYFWAATASLYDSYQPGIDLLHRLIIPGFLIGGIFLIASLTKSHSIVRLTVLLSSAAVVICTLLLVVVVGSTPSTDPAPDDHSLKSTIEFALSRPSFSNRSVVVVFESGAFAGLVLFGSLRLSRRIRRQTASGG